MYQEVLQTSKLQTKEYQKMIRIIPQNGLKVINPETMKALPMGGAVIRELNTYWNARLVDGDIKVEDLKNPIKVEVKK